MASWIWKITCITFSLQFYVKTLRFYSLYWPASPDLTQPWIKLAFSSSRIQTSESLRSKTKKNPYNKKNLPVCCSGETANIDVGFVPLILLPVISKPSSSDLSPKLLISIICTRGLFEELRKLKSLKKKTKLKKTDTNSRDYLTVRD